MAPKNDLQVVFGTGPLGLAVMDALLEKGYGRILMVNRSGKAPEALPPGVRLQAGDATDPVEVEALAAGAAVVFHCAQPGYTEWPEKFPPITEGILASTIRARVERLVFGDNLYMYGPTDGEPLHEDLPYAATGRKGRTRAEMAELLLAAHEAGRVRTAIGRASDFYGPRVLGSAAGEMVFGKALEGKAAAVMGNLDVPHTYTYIKDFGRGLVTLAEHEEAFGRAWHVPSAKTVTTREFLEMVYEEAGHERMRAQAANRFMTGLLGLFVPEMREFGEIFYEFAAPYVVQHDRFEQAFGASPTPHREAVRETLAWYRAHAGRED